MVQILIADDEPDILQHLCELFRSAGYEVEGDTGGDTLLEKIKNTDFDLVITDFFLNNLPGEFVISEIWKDKPDQDIIVMTGHKNAENLKHEHPNLINVFAKPFRSSELLGFITLHYPLGT